MKFWRRYSQNIGTAVIQLVNAVFLFGDADKSISGRSYRQGTIDEVKCWVYNYKYKLMIVIFTTVFLTACTNRVYIGQPVPGAINDGGFDAEVITRDDAGNVVLK